MRVRCWRGLAPGGSLRVVLSEEGEGGPGVTVRVTAIAITRVKVGLMVRVMRGG